MSLAIVFKGPEGVVLAADSRVTLLAQVQGPGAPGAPPTLMPATFDNATKLLSVPSQRHIAAVTYGVGALGTAAPRTAASYIPEFDFQLSQHAAGQRLTVEEFARRLSGFFQAQWTASGMPANTPMGQDMTFLVGGYDDEQTAYGRVFEVRIPTAPDPIEKIPVNEFGAIWGGQRELTDRLIGGFDPQLPLMVQQILNVPAAEQQARASTLDIELRRRLQIPIPWQFLPLQDSVDLSIFLLRTTITLQKWTVGVRGVGGAIDLATITRTEGFAAIQQKRISGEQTQTKIGS